MKQPRRWAMLLIALLVAASLVITPREGGAGGNWQVDSPGDPQLPAGFGDPDLPDGPSVIGTITLNEALILAKQAILVRLLPYIDTPKSCARAKTCQRPERER